MTPCQRSVVLRREWVRRTRKSAMDDWRNEDIYCWLVGATRFLRIRRSHRMSSFRPVIIARFSCSAHHSRRRTTLVAWCHLPGILAYRCLLESHGPRCRLADVCDRRHRSGACVKQPGAVREFGQPVRRTIRCHVLNDPSTNGSAQIARPSGAYWRVMRVCMT